MFNLSLHENEIDFDDFEVDTDEGGRPHLCDMTNVSGFLDKDLEASGFTRKDEDDMDKEQRMTSSNWDNIEIINEASLANFDSFTDKASELSNMHLKKKKTLKTQSEMRRLRQQAIKAITWWE
ncbi:hypothetical protein OROMI_027949 [Orobanche minor]